MAAKRPSIPLRTKKRLLQEAGCRCPFCGYDKAEDLEFHHIEEWHLTKDHDFENLIVACPNCHARITEGAISEADVRLQKRMLKFQQPSHQPAASAQNNVFNGAVGIVAQTVNFGKSRSPKIAHPLGSIGANLSKKNYIAYLIERYFEFRKADASFGATSHAKNFHHSELHRTVCSKFGAKTYFVPEHRFEELAAYLQGRIDRTILGKRNLKGGHPRYKSFETFCSEYG